MDSTDSQTLTALTDEQIEQVAAIVLDEFGPALHRTQFNGVVLGLFENIAGFEPLTHKLAMRYLRSLWITYRRLVTSNRTH